MHYRSLTDPTAGQHPRVLEEADGVWTGAAHLFHDLQGLLVIAFGGNDAGHANPRLGPALVVGDEALHNPARERLRGPLARGFRTGLPGDVGRCGTERIWGRRGWEAGPYRIAVAMSDMVTRMVT